jgi:hypothetical protein
MENIAISTIVGTSSHIKYQQYKPTSAMLRNLNTVMVDTGNDTPETNTWINLQKIGCAVIWKGAGRFVTWSFRT